MYQYQLHMHLYKNIRAFNKSFKIYTRHITYYLIKKSALLTLPFSSVCSSSFINFLHKLLNRSKLPLFLCISTAFLIRLNISLLFIISPNCFHFGNSSLYIYFHISKVQILHITYLSMVYN